MKSRWIIIIIILLNINEIALSAARMSLSEAVNKKLITYSLQHSVFLQDSLANRKGIRMMMSVQNLSQGTLNLVMESGRRFTTEDSSYQNLILTEERVITLQPRQYRDYLFLAFCTNETRHSPSVNFYQVGPMADGLLLKLSQYLNKNLSINTAAQEAIWVITNKRSILTVKGKTTLETRQIRNYLYNLTGLPRPPRSTDPLSYPLVSVSGKVDWVMPADGKVTMTLSDEHGRQIGYLVSNRSYTKGKQFYLFNYKDDTLIPGKTYRVKLLVEDNVFKELAVKGREEL
ncbi:MAG: hypothetical protein NTU44_10970 [Bacteroidetes bacterium]|nr:hypothetical protein [Bacteroidota bacterium]